MYTLRSIITTHIFQMSIHSGVVVARIPDRDTSFTCPARLTSSDQEQ